MGSSGGTSNLLRSRIEHLRADASIYGHRLFLHYGDLSDGTTLRRIFAQVRPAEVYHLAGQSHVGLSFEIPESTSEEVAMATLRLLEISPRSTAAGPLLSRVELGDFRARDRIAANGRDPAAAGQPVWLREGFRDSVGAGLPAGLRPLCLQRHSVQSRIAAPWGEFVMQKIARAAARISRGLEHELVLGNTSRGAIGATPASTSRLCGSCCNTPYPDDYVVATGETHSVRGFRRARPSSGRIFRQRNI